MLKHIQINTHTFNDDDYVDDSITNASDDDDDDNDDDDVTTEMHSIQCDCQFYTYFSILYDIIWLLPNNGIFLKVFVSFYYCITQPWAKFALLIK